MTTTENGQREPNLLLASKALAESATGIHYWQDAKRQYADARNRADRDIQHADECIARHAEKLQEALTELGLTAAPEAEVA